MTTELISEINQTIYGKNTDELEKCFDRGLVQDGGESWVTGSQIIDALTEHGYILIKAEVF